MLIKSLVLYIYKSFLHMLRNIVNIHPDTVGSRCDKLCHFISIRVYHDGLVSSRNHTGAVNIRRIVDDSLDDSDSGAQTDHACCQQANQKCFYKNYAGLFTGLRGLGVHRLLLFRSTAFPVIHVLSSYTSNHYIKK